MIFSVFFLPHTVVSLVLMGTMGYRYLNSGKLMPAGLVAALRLVWELWEYGIG